MPKRKAKSVDGRQSREKRRQEEADFEQADFEEGSITEWELLKLSESIGPSDYYKVGLSLKIPYAQLEGVMNKQLNDNTNALFSVFMKWQMKQRESVNKRDVLADCLHRSGLVELSDELRRGKLCEDFTENPSRPLYLQSEPLSPELVKRCKDDFMFKYRSTLCKIRSDPLDPGSLVEFMYMYTNLVLKKEEQRGQRVERKLLPYDELRQLISIGEFPRRLLLLGEAGAGKSTLCAKIAWDWINGKSFKKFDWVLIVPLRECKRYSIGQIAKAYLTKSNPTTASQLNHYMRSNPDKVFIASDGLDELSSTVEELKEHVPKTCHQSQSRPSTSDTCSSLPRVDNSGLSDNPEQSDDIDIRDILCSEELETCPVLVTSRPWRAKEIRSDGDLSKLYTFIHLEGFNEDGLSDYIHKFFPENDAIAKRLIQLTKESDVISQNIAHYPIYVAMLCLMWKEISEREREEFASFQTFSQVFTKMFAFLKEHYAQKKIKNVLSPELRDYLQKINNLLEPVNSVALSGLLKDKLVFNERDFQHCPESMDIACRVGILSQEKHMSSMLDCKGSLPRNETRVFFPHKLFQEYMAGMSFASKCRSDCSEFEKLMSEYVLPGGDKFRYLLYFSASLDREVGRTIMEYMVQIPEERNDLLVDVAFESNNPEAVDVMHDWFPPEQQTINIRYDMTSHTIAAYKATVNDTYSIMIGRECNSVEPRDLAVMIYSAPSLASLSIGGSFHNDFWNILKEHAANIQAEKLTLGFIHGLTHSSSSDLAEILSLMPNLDKFSLGPTCHTLCDEFFSTLKERAKDLRIKTLKLCDEIKFEDTSEVDPSLSSRNDEDLAEALSLMPCLQDLTLKLVLQKPLFREMYQRALSVENAFPQVASGNFILNGQHQKDMASFLHTLDSYEDPEEQTNWQPENEDDDISEDETDCHSESEDEDISEDETDCHSESEDEDIPDDEKDLK